MSYKLALIIIFTLLLSACSKSVSIPNLSKTSINSEEFILKQYHTKLEYQDVNAQNIKMPEVGEKNSYGITVTSQLKSAYESYLFGDGHSALTALNEASKTDTENKLYQWQISFLKAKTLTMMGLDADAIIELEKSEKLELKAFGHNLNSLALRGEVSIMEGNFKLARKNFYSVLTSIGEWELPTSYSMPPSNIKELVSITTAQLRSITGIGASYMMEENYEKAYFWAKEAEKRFNAVHYVSNHFIYGVYLKTHLDSYYGRALNMAVLASSVLALKEDIKTSNLYYKRALDFFDFIGYKKGKIIILALKAKALLSLEKYDQSEKVADQAIKIALANNMYDFVWRIEMLKGYALLKEEKTEKAKIAFLNAANVIDLVSGELQTDFSKRRFGIGKNDLVYELMQINLEEDNLAELFLHVEQGKARAFVDVMRNKIINQNNLSADVKPIQELDKKIKILSVKNSLSTTSQSLENENRLRKQREDLVQKLFISSPKSASVISSLSYTLKNVQNRLSSDEAILYFLPVKNYENIQYLLIQQKRVSLQEYNLSSNQLSSFLSEYLAVLDAYYALKKTSTNLDKLKNKISLSNIEQNRIYIVGSGQSSYIPWYGLDTKKEISIIPSISTLFFKHEKVKSVNNIILGNPYFAKQLPQLEGAKQEAIEIASYYNVKPLLYKNATHSNLRHALKNKANVLHFATHGIFDFQKPMSSSIFLSEKNKLFTWSASDILQEEIKSNLVVLSACKTGMGKSIEDDDLLGLPRSLFLSGTKAVLSSLWSIDDKKTKEFMLEFHKLAKDGKYAKALKQTVELFKEKGYDPSVYGAFVLYGTDLN